MFPQRQRRGIGEGHGECNESRGVCHTDADPPAAAAPVDMRARTGRDATTWAYRMRGPHSAFAMSRAVTWNAILLQVGDDRDSPTIGPPSKARASASALLGCRLAGPVDRGPICGRYYYRPDHTPLRPPDPPPTTPAPGSTGLRRRHPQRGHTITHTTPGARSGGSPIRSRQTTLDALFSWRVDDAAILDYFVAATQMAWFSVRTRPSAVVSGAHASVTLRQTCS
jgi:hypothetical protein